VSLVVSLSTELPFSSSSAVAAALGLVANVPGAAAWCQRANMGLVINMVWYGIWFVWWFLEGLVQRLSFDLPPRSWTGLAFMVIATTIERYKDMHTLCLFEARDDRWDKRQRESKNLAKRRLRRMVIGTGAQRAIVNTWEIKQAQELTHALKRPEWMLGNYLWQICGLCGNRRSRQRKRLR